MAAVVLLAVGLVTASVVTASGPPDGTDSAIETPSYPDASYDPPTPSGGESDQATVRESASPSPAPTTSALRPTGSPVSRGGDRATLGEGAPEVTPRTDAATPTPTPRPTPTTEQPAAEAPQTTATTRSTNASRWVIGVGSDTDATYECSLDGGAYQSCGPTVTYDDLDKGTHSFAARATDGEGNTDPSPATLTAEIGPPGKG